MIALERYATLFREPGMTAVLLASVVGRIPIGVATLAILLSVQAHAGSFSRAGVAAACYVLGLAVVAPLLGRLIDQFGPRPILATSAVAYPTALGVFVLLLHASAAPAAVAVCAAAAGAALPPITIAVRALLPRALADMALLQTAYSVDSALMEFVFILGPALVAAWVAHGYADGAVLLAAVAGAGGTGLFLRCSAVRGWKRSAGITPRQRFGPLRLPALRAVLATTLLYSIGFGLFEVGVTAFAGWHGTLAAAGVILALASLGSAAGAVWYGSRSWSPSLARQYLLALVAMATGMLLLVPVQGIVSFAALSVLSGVPMATVIAVQSLLIVRLTPRTLLAESFTWGTTCLLGGISAGIAAGGVMAEFLPPGAVLATAACAAGLAATAAWAGVREGCKV
jgi:hypothetical protein